MSVSRDWSELPPELVHKISTNLTTFKHYIHFRTVCTTWHSSTPSKPTHLPPQHPWLMLPTNQSSNTRGFYNILENKYHYLNLPEASSRPRRRRCGSSNGWLIILDESSPLIFIINPLTRLTFNLPHLSLFPNVINFNYYNVGREYTLMLSYGRVKSLSLKQMCDLFIKKFVLSNSPLQSRLLGSSKMHAAHVSGGSEQYRLQQQQHTQYISQDSSLRGFSFSVMVILNETSELCYWNSSSKDNSWKLIDNPRFYTEDVIYVNGLFYAVDKFGALVVIDVSNDDLPSLKFVEMLGRVNGDMQYLVKTNDDDVLLVSRFLEPDDRVADHQMDVLYKTVEFRVFKLVFVGGYGCWERMSSLGDEVLFLGENSSVAIRASDFPGCVGNRIYFTDDYCEANYDGVDGEHDLGYYDLEDGKIEALPCYPRGSNSMLRWPPPIWLTPNPC